MVRFFFSSKAGQSCPHSNSSIYKAQSYKKPPPPWLYPPCDPLFLPVEVCVIVFIFTFLFSIGKHLEIYLKLLKGQFFPVWINEMQIFKLNEN